MTITPEGGEPGGGMYVVPDPGSPPPTVAARPRARRRLSTVATVAAVVVLLGAALLSRGGPPDPAGSGATSTGTAGATTGGSPAGSASASPPAPLPRYPAGLPERVVVEPLPARALSAAPVRTARALVQPVWPDRMNGPVLVLGDDGELRVLDVGDLGPVIDADGNPQRALDATSLSPNGTRAAFAQRDRVVVVDLTTATARSVGVAGPNENVAWLTGDQIVVSQGPASFVVGPGDAVRRVPYRGGDAAVPATAGVVVELTVQAAVPGPRLREWQGERAARDVPVVVPAGLVAWAGPGQLRGRWLARAALFGDGTAPPAPAVLLIDVDIGVVLRVERMPVATPPGTPSYTVLGWHQEGTVIVGVSGPHDLRLLAWDVRAGSVGQVSEIVGPAPVVALPADR